MDPLVAIILALAAVNWWRTARSRRLRDAGLCQRCGARAAVEKRFDLVAEAGLCASCSTAVSSFGGIDSKVVAGGLGALCGAGVTGLFWSILALGDRLLLPALSMGCIVGAVLFAKKASGAK